MRNKILAILLAICLLSSSAYAFQTGNGHITERLRYPACSLKAHRTTVDTTITTNTWTNCSGFTEFGTGAGGETLGKCAEVNADTETIDILKDGFYLIGGCLHVQNNTVGIFSGLTLLSRILYNVGQPNEDELRCLQAGYVETIAAGAEDIITYHGTAYLNKGDTLNLQYYTDESDVEFLNNSAYSNNVAYTIWLIGEGE